MAVWMRENGHVVRALTIAGSDSGGGAGIQADLKTFAAFSVYGLSVVTALTAQNTVGVQAVRYMDPEFVQLQFDSVLDDIGTDATKIGMLGSSAIIAAVAAAVQARGLSQLVVDPVMVAKGGASLMDADAVAVLKAKLLPLAAIITPNIPEAEVLWGHRIDSYADCVQAARELHALGPRCVVIKGGHAQAHWANTAAVGKRDAWQETLAQGQQSGTLARAVDVVFDGQQVTSFSTPRVSSHKTHGTGCTFSSAITASLARGSSVMDALAQAKSFIYQAILSAAQWDVGTGHGPTDHSVSPRFSTGLVAGKAYRWAQGQWQEA
jgi:hydroxymethylpyrimidine/phosphomethylpyrimidine kinase